MIRMSAAMTRSNSVGPVVGGEAVLAHVGLDAGRQVEVDGADLFDGHPVGLHARRSGSAAGRRCGTAPASGLSVQLMTMADRSEKSAGLVGGLVAHGQCSRSMRGRGNSPTAAVFPTPWRP